MSVADTSSPLLTGTVSLYTEGCQTAFDDTQISGIASLNYINELEVLDNSLDANSIVNELDYIVLDSILTYIQSDDVNNTKKNELLALRKN